MEGVVELFDKQSTRGDGKIERTRMKQVIRFLDGTGFWTDEKLEDLFQTTGESGDLLDYTSFIRSVCITDSEPPAELLAAVRADLVRIMDSPDWDDGSYAPLLIRLAWHSSGTYSAKDGSGGSNGATMRFPLEANDPENVRLPDARALLEPLKWKYPKVSYADLWILAAYVAIEHTGGPTIQFCGGRVDKTEEAAIAPGRLPGAEYGLADGMDVDAEGRLKGWENLAQHIRDVFGRMGLSQREAVALICGGHVYGRCHPESSGYAGAWVENPTIFSNEYCKDMLDDKWMAVAHDTRMPDGGDIPPEVRPGPGKRQYVDLTKYESAEEEEAATEAPDVKDFPPGKYRCSSMESSEMMWVNVQESADPKSPIIGRFINEQVLQFLVTEVCGTEVRGRAERGGWVTLASGSTRHFTYVSEFVASELSGQYRVVAQSGAQVFSTPSNSVPAAATLECGQEADVVEVNGSVLDGFFGKLRDGRGWMLLYSQASGVVADIVVAGWNHKPRQPLKGQTGDQMMLVSDMVLAWDEKFREVLQEYADDEDKLKKEFGLAFKRLTELGCPWSKDRVIDPPACPATGKSGTGCPVIGSFAN
mmetsp:Transcript_29023/g.66708  ORF Transcript_29023/g.66708 Transcript_29023/m.66708 type:complete len:590 (+) Transcript_29023:74-1843(+)